jgi:ribonuclease BN (tRNA processing enzyme)
MMEIVLLGTGVLIPNKSRNAAGILVKIINRSNGKNVYLLFDCGNGILRQIEKAGVPFQDINHVFFSHYHTDHFSDFVPLIMGNKMKERTEILHVHGPKGLNDIIHALLTKVYPYLEETLSFIEINEVKDGLVQENKDWRIYCTKVEHGDALGYKIVADTKSIVYSGDTGYSENLLELSKDADLLIHECSNPDGEGQYTKLHVTPSILGEFASKANVKKLVLTHMYPVCTGREKEMVKNIKKNYKGKVIIGKDLLKIKL